MILRGAIILLFPSFFEGGGGDAQQESTEIEQAAVSE